MVATTPKNLDKLLYVKEKQPVLCIFHGVNTELRVQSLKKVFTNLDIPSDDPFRYVRLDSNILDEDPGRLADEIGAIAMFGGMRLIHVTALPRQASKIISVVYDNKPGDYIVILDISAPLDTAIIEEISHKWPDIIIVECAIETSRDFHDFVSETFKQQGVTATQEAIRLLVSHIGHDRSAAILEVEKLVAYSKNKTVEGEDVKTVVADASALFTDEIAAVAFSGNVQILSQMLDRIIHGSNEPVQSLLALSRQCLSLHRSKVKNWTGNNTSSNSHLKPENLRALSRAIATAIYQTRKDGLTAEIIAQRMLMALAQNANRTHH